VRNILLKNGFNRGTVIATCEEKETIIYADIGKQKRKRKC
jgi:hypothetical protein